MKMSILSILLPLAFALTFLLGPVHADTGTVSAFGLNSDQIIFAGVLLGIFFRVTFPYLAKARAAAQASIGTNTPIVPFKFDYHYAVIAIGNLVQSAIVTILLFPNLPSLSGFLGAFAYGYTSQDILSQFL